MKSNFKINMLLSKLNAAKEESLKAESYADGYLDCLKDLLNDDAKDFSNILSIKYDGKIRAEVYSEIIPALEDALKDTSGGTVQEATPSTSNHPSDRAASFLQRVRNSDGNQG